MYYQKKKGCCYECKERTATCHDICQKHKQEVDTYRKRNEFAKQTITRTHAHELRLKPIDTVKRYR